MEQIVKYLPLKDLLNGKRRLSQESKAEILKFVEAHYNNDLRKYFELFSDIDTKMTPLHSYWIYNLAFRDQDWTLQAHRGSFKSTCVLLSLALRLLYFPNQSNLILRMKYILATGMLRGVANLITTPQWKELFYMFHGKKPILEISQTEIKIAGFYPQNGEPNLQAGSIQATITGLHPDRIFTDDIVTKESLFSPATRVQVNNVFIELQNLRMEGHYILNTGTPWHKDDAFSLMPTAEKYDCFSTGLMDLEQINRRKELVGDMIFSVNYKLTTVESYNQFFQDISIMPYQEFKRWDHCFIQVDASYGGEDYTAVTVAFSVKSNIYVYGICRQISVNKMIGEIVDLCTKYRAKSIHMESNADKGYLAQIFKERLRLSNTKVRIYFESQNKHEKILDYILSFKNRITILDNSERMYIDQIVNYELDVAHDDAPDSLASLIRILYHRKQ